MMNKTDITLKNALKTPLTKQDLQSTISNEPIQFAHIYRPTKQRTSAILPSVRDLVFFFQLSSDG